MKLWEKNYILTMILIMTVIYCSLFVNSYSSFQMNFERVCTQAIQTEKTISYTAKNFITETTQYKKLQLYCETMATENIHFSIFEGDNEIVTNIPYAYSFPQSNVSVIKYENKHYLCIYETFAHLHDKFFSIYYIEDIEEIYSNHQRQIVLFSCAGAFISVLLAIILHFAMKKMYYPVNNIAHELRTPLTSIQGYAQYILYGKISEEEILYAGEQIRLEAIYMNDIIDRLLIMENLKNGQIIYSKVYTNDLFGIIKEHYPSITIDNQTEYITGDRTLLLSLFLNLLSNTNRNGTQIHITTHDNIITIHNKDDHIDKKMLKILNTNRTIPKNKVHGKGLGVSLCHEIVKMHKGTLYYTSDSDGVYITITFSK
ncbi:MAG: HAMP domain-containing histidine kinase [Lachnospiraceae bacterium]|nr:HAMP domain-containing histidine kinase [Lachnospiraceae bacterium]